MKAWCTWRVALNLAVLGALVLNVWMAVESSRRRETMGTLDRDTAFACGQLAFLRDYHRYAVPKDVAGYCRRLLGGLWWHEPFASGQREGT